VPKISLSRRHVVKALIALGAVGFSARVLHGFNQDDTQLSIEVKDGEGLPRPSLALFASLSSLVTLKDDLDEVVTEKMYQLFLDEPWGKEHITGCYKKIRDYLQQISENARPSFNDPGWQFTKGERWFITHLLTTWYLGTYYHENRPILYITHEHALMYDHLEGIVPTPFLEPVGFGTWAEPPKEVE